MNETLIKKSFKTFLQGKDLEESSLSLNLFPTVFVEYFQEVKFDDVDEQNDGDMLLFQYGTYNLGKGRLFEIDFTRQLIEVIQKENAHSIYQLSFTFYYETDSFKEFNSTTKWSVDFEKIEELRKFILDSHVYKLALKEIPIKSENRVTLV